MATVSGCYLMVRSCPYERRRLEEDLRTRSPLQGASIVSVVDDQWDGPRIGAQCLSRDTPSALAEGFSEPLSVRAFLFPSDSSKSEYTSQE
jgi:hypothetical protein